MPFVAECARYNHDSGNVNTITQNFTHAVAAGQTIVLFVNAPVTAAITGWTITDSKSNTWTIGSVVEQTTPVNYDLTLATCKVTSAIATTDSYTITVTGANPAKWCVLAAIFDDLASATLDASGITSGTSSSLTVSTSGATTQASELVVAGFAYTDATTPVGFTAGSGYTAVGSPVIASPTSAPRTLAVEYKYVTATGTQTATGTLGTSEGYGAIVAALKKTVAATVVRRLKTASGYTALTTRVA